MPPHAPGPPEADAGLSRAHLTAIRRDERRALWMPIVVLEVYLAVTVLLFFAGPVNWDVPSRPKLMAFLVLNYTGLAIGYGWGIRRGRRALRQLQAPDAGSLRIPTYLPRLIWLSMVFTVVGAAIRLYIMRGGFSEVLATILNPGAAYREAQIIAQLDRDGQLTAAAGAHWAFRVTTLFQVLNGLYFPLGLACWSRLRPASRAMFLISVTVGVVFTMGIGAQSGIGAFVFASLPVALFSIYVRGRRLTTAPPVIAPVMRTRSRALRARLLAVGAVVSVLITVALFQVSRAEDTGKDLDASNFLVGQFGTPSDRGLVRATGTRANFGLIATVQYLSHGYEGLALAMELPFVPMYGLGWSKATQVMYRDYLGGRDLFDRSYLARNEVQNGWTALILWSTIFPWIASDTSFYGTVFAMMLIGFVLGRGWTAVVVRANPVGFALLAQLFTLVFMFPANNAVAQTLDALFSFGGVAALYVASQRYDGARSAGRGSQRGNRQFATAAS